MVIVYIKKCYQKIIQEEMCKCNVILATVFLLTFLSS